MKKNEKIEKAPVREVKTTKLGRVTGAATVAAVKKPAGAVSTRVL
jgi:hypothetical protein